MFDIVTDLVSLTLDFRCKGIQQLKCSSCETETSV